MCSRDFLLSLLSVVVVVVVVLLLEPFSFVGGQELPRSILRDRPAGTLSLLK
jgi:hypothetical protein